MYVHLSIPTYGLNKRDLSKLRKALSTVNKMLTREGLEQRAPASLSFGTRSKAPSKPTKVKIVYVPAPAPAAPTEEPKPRRRRKAVPKQ